jgi:hypothetical protein
VIAVRRDSDARFRVRVLPMTHTPPHPDRAVALPPKVMRHLGLEEEASWIVLDEANDFVWPGVDLRPISRARPGLWSYGVLPQEVFVEIQARLRLLRGQRQMMRDE